jgi:hypothetical protein
MADLRNPETSPKRWVIVKFFEHAIERTEEQIAELKAGGLHVRDATGPGDLHQGDAPPQPAPAPAPKLPAFAGAPAGDKPGD